MSNKQFECPVCLEIMLKEISMCHNGHNLCQTCKNSLRNQKCPVCRGDFIKGRNFALEAVIRSKDFKIKNEGKSRNQGKYSCVVEDCCWKGMLPIIYFLCDSFCLENNNDR